MRCYRTVSSVGPNWVNELHTLSIQCPFGLQKKVLSMEKTKEIIAQRRAAPRSQQEAAAADFPAFLRERPKSRRQVLKRLMGATLGSIAMGFGRRTPMVAAQQTGCITVSASANPWHSVPFTAPRAGSFVTEMQAIPQANGIDAGVALSDRPQTQFTGLAAIARFNQNGFIDARNGSAYMAAAAIRYMANTKYNLRFVVEVTAHRYSLYVRPEGSVEQAVGINYSFRTEQSSVPLLDTWTLFADSGSMQGCRFGDGCVTASTGQGWKNTAFVEQRKIFTAEWDASPSVVGLDGVMGSLGTLLYIG
jgi:hypothetical protein